MRNVKDMQIIRVEAEGFKKFRERVSFELGEITSITGGNRQGKSTIADMIAFTFTGLNFSGDHRGTDRLKSDGGNGVISASVTYLDENSEQHTLTRVRNAKDATTITLDGYSVRQTDLDELFGGVHIFLGILNPRYLTDIAADRAKEILEKLLPVVRHEDVLAALGSSSAVELLQNESIFSPEAYQSAKRLEIRELEEELKRVEGKIELIEEKHTEQERRKKKLNSELMGIDNRIVQLETTISADGAQRQSDEQLAELYAKRDELQDTLAEEAPAPALSDELAETLQSISETEQTRYVGQNDDELIQLAGEKKVLIAEYKRQKEQITGLSPESECPTCLRSITAEEYPTVHKNVLAKLQHIVSEGQAVSRELEALTDKENIARIEFDNAKAKRLSDLNNTVEALRGGIQAEQEAHRMQMQAVRAQLGEINNQIEAYSESKQYGSLTADEITELEDLRQQREKVNAVLAATDSYGNVEEYVKQCRDIKSEIFALNELIQASTTYASERARLMFSGLPLNKVAIVLFDIIKSNGSVRDTFRFSYDGRDYRKLSLSEQVCAGLEVCELMKALTGRNYPTIVDNYESMEKPENISLWGQYIFLSVQKRSELSVRIVKESPQAEYKKTA
ncbi:AAA family ATPase [Oscillospiraceae bacterium OttesenSCG-928-F05]|nr:AAA family ATPase [Oscillospiraceae bacterium OttesenSCG-928-F05]